MTIATLSAGALLLGLHACLGLRATDGDSVSFVRAVVAHGATYVSGNGELPDSSVLIDIGSFSDEAGSVLGNSMSVDDLASALGGRMRNVTSAEAVVCDLKDGQCRLRGGIVFVRLDSLVVESANTSAYATYIRAERRPSGAVGLCTLPVLLKMTETRGTWRVVSAQPLLRC